MDRPNRIGAIRIGGGLRYRTDGVSVFRLVKALAVIRNFQDADQSFFSIAMRLSWPQHLQTARMLEGASQSDCGTALALMGISLLILAEDLLAAEQATTAQPRLS